MNIDQEGHENLRHCWGLQMGAFSRSPLACVAGAGFLKKIKCELESLLLG